MSNKGFTGFQWTTASSIPGNRRPTGFLLAIPARRANWSSPALFEVSVRYDFFRYERHIVKLPDGDQRVECTLQRFD